MFNSTLQEVGVEEVNLEDPDNWIMPKRSKARISHQAGWELMRPEILANQMVKEIGGIMAN